MLERKDALWPSPPHYEHEQSLLRAIMKLAPPEMLPQDVSDAIYPRLAMEDIRIPDLRNTLELCSIIAQHRPIEVPLQNSPESNPQHRKNRRPQDITEEISVELVQNLEFEYISSRYVGLTEAEKGLAFSRYFSPGAHVVSQKTDSGLYALHEEALKETGLDDPHKEKTRLILIQSDRSNAMALPGKPDAVLLSTNMLERCTPEEIKAIMLHECKHLKDSKSKGYHVKKYINDIAYKYVPIIQKHNPMQHIEYKADMHAVKVMKDSRPLESALIKAADRNAELLEFARKVIPACRELFEYSADESCRDNHTMKALLPLLQFTHAAYSVQPFKNDVLPREYLDIPEKLLLEERSDVPLYAPPLREHIREVKDIVREEKPHNTHPRSHDRIMRFIDKADKIER